MRDDATPRDSRTETIAGDRLFWRIAALSLAVALITLVVSQFATTPETLHPGSLPRIPQPPTNTTQLLRILGIGSLMWYMCLASAPVFFWGARRAPLERGRLLSSVALIAFVIVTFAVIAGLLQYRVSYHGSPLAPPLSEYLIVALITGLLPFATVAAATHAIDARARANERAFDAERMRAQLAESRLETLSAQLQPHFLFNTLQGISTLISHDPVAADEMLVSLSDLLREVLRRGDRREVPLTDEMRVLESYLAISRRRFGDRLTIDVCVETAAYQALVPFFILQPLVENALQHGIASHAGPGHVKINVRRDDDSLILSVVDDGPGMAAPDTGRGIGVANTAARLTQLYASRQSLFLTRTAAGFEAKITLPFSTAVRAAHTT
jgi:two-component system LytT family sensor kinase